MQKKKRTALEATVDAVGRDDLIVAGVAVSLAASFSDLLHGVNDNQLRVGVFLYEILKLLVKTVSDFLRKQRMDRQPD